MKRKKLAIMGMLVAITFTAGGCGKSAAEQSHIESQKIQEEKNMTYGQVKQKETDSILLAIGEKKTPEEESAPSSMLNLTGEESTIHITEKTKIVRQSRERNMEGAKAENEPPKGEKPKGGESPKNGERPSEKQPPEEQEETLKFSDIQTGDVIAVSQKDGTAEKIIVISPEQKEQSGSEERSM